MTLPHIGRCTSITEACQRIFYVLKPFLGEPCVDHNGESAGRSHEEPQNSDFGLPDGRYNANIAGPVATRTMPLTTLATSSTANEVDYYSLEWFKILIISAFLIIIAIIIYIFRCINTLLDSSFSNVPYIACIALGLSCCYIGICVALTTYQAFLTPFCAKYLKLSPPWQRRCLRLISWCYLPISMGVTIFVMVYNEFFEILL